MKLLYEQQVAIERLAAEAIEAAAGGTLQRNLLHAVVDGVRDAASSGASVQWIAKIQYSVEQMVKTLEKHRLDSNCANDAYRRRRTVRIESPKLKVYFGNGLECTTIDWSAYGVLISGVTGYHDIGSEVSIRVESDVVDGGGDVIGQVVWCSAEREEIALEFIRPSVVVQTMKVRMMKAGLILHPK